MMISNALNAYNDVRHTGRKVQPVDASTHLDQNKKETQDLIDRSIKFDIVDGIPVVRYKDAEGKTQQIPTEEALKNKRIAEFLLKVEQDLFKGFNVDLHV